MHLLTMLVLALYAIFARCLKTMVSSPLLNTLFYTQEISKINYGTAAKALRISTLPITI